MADQNLFGMMDPELVKQAIAAQQEQGLMAKAKLSPEELMRYSAMAGAQKTVEGLGGLVGGIFGVEAIDPRVRKAQIAQGVLTEVNQLGLDPNSPDYFAQVARVAQQRGLPDLAQMAAAQAQTIMKVRTEIGLNTAKTMAEINKATTEANPFAKIDPSKYTPESLAKYKETKNEADLRLNPEAVGGGAKITFAQESKFAGQRGEDQAKALAAAAEAAKGARASMSALGEMDKLASSGQLYSGPLAMTAVGASNLLSSLGLLSPTDSRTLANSEIYDKKAKDLVMQELNGKLGAQISDSDRKFIEARIPQLTNSPLARQELIAKLKEIQIGKISLYQKMNAHANQYGQLNNFDFSQDYMPVGISSSPMGTKDNPIKLK